PRTCPGRRAAPPVRSGTLRYRPSSGPCRQRWWASKLVGSRVSRSAVLASCADRRTACVPMLACQDCQELSGTSQLRHLRSGGMAQPHPHDGDATGDWQPPSWEEIVRENGDRVFRLAYRLTGNRADAEDLTQEVFVRVFRSLHQYRPGTFAGWLHRITTNLFLDGQRRKKRIRFDALGPAAERIAASSEST